MKTYDSVDLFISDIQDKYNLEYTNKLVFGIGKFKIVYNDLAYSIYDLNRLYYICYEIAIYVNNDLQKACLFEIL